MKNVAISVLTYSIWYALYDNPYIPVSMFRPAFNPAYTMFEE